MVEPTGAQTIAALKLGECEVTGMFEPDGAPSAGEAVSLGLDMGHVCLFDPKTQLLIK